MKTKVVIALAATVMTSTQLVLKAASESKMAPKMAATPAKDTLSADDKKFVMESASGGMLEVKLGTVATKQAKSSDVKQFGAHMVSDHSKGNAQLKAIASRKKIMLPAKLNAEHQAVFARLSKLSGAAFDRAYMSDMVEDHTKDVAEFKKEASGGKDADVKGFAAKTVPTLQMHLKMATTIHNKMK